ALGQAKPDRAAPLHLAGECAIVDQLAFQGFPAADALIGAAAEKDAAARRGRGRAAGIVRPGEGIEHREEEHERRNEKALSEALAAQLDHQRDEVAPLALEPCD